MLRQHTEAEHDEGRNDINENKENRYGYERKEIHPDSVPANPLAAKMTDLLYQPNPPRAGFFISEGIR